MLKITEDALHGCFLLEPSGALSRRDLDALSERFDATVGATDRVPNLVVRAESFPTWTDFAALLTKWTGFMEHDPIASGGSTRCSLSGSP